MTAAAVTPLVGRQTPTFLWMPDHGETYGQEVIDLAAAHGLVLDEWQRLGCNLTCALTPRGDTWACFENAMVVSRQNGKDSWIEALELSWLYLFGDELVTHSAHLFETSREHFLRIQALITNYDDLRRRVRRMREGRGSEEVELIPVAGQDRGPRLKFMTRKGGAGRGFTGNHIVLNEAMYLDAAMMAAALPALASVPDVQVLYAGSAGMKHSTQLAAVRRRALAQDDPSLMYLEWAAEPAVYGGDGELLAGDDPASPTTWAKVNPAYSIRISESYIRKEMRALGGPRSKEFGTERLGIGDWPAEDATWEVISEAAWDLRADPGSQIAEGQAIALAIHADKDRAMGTIGVCGLRADGRDHVEVIERHRGTGWIVDAVTGERLHEQSPDDPPLDGTPPVDGVMLTDYERAILERMRDLKTRHRIAVVIVLKTATTGSLIAALKAAGFRVESPSEIQYAQWCGMFAEAVTETGTVVHIDQASARTALGGARKRTSAEGGWRWSPDAPTDSAPAVVFTLALGGRRTYPAIPRSRVW
jgi:hypothetical protein